MCVIFYINIINTGCDVFFEERKRFIDLYITAEFLLPVNFILLRSKIILLIGKISQNNVYNVERIIRKQLQSLFIIVDSFRIFSLLIIYQCMIVPAIRIFGIDLNCFFKITEC